MKQINGFRMQEIYSSHIWEDNYCKNDQFNQRFYTGFVKL